MEIRLRIKRGLTGRKSMVTPDSIVVDMLRRSMPWVHGIFLTERGELAAGTRVLYDNKTGVVRIWRNEAEIMEIPR